MYKCHHHAVAKPYLGQHLVKEQVVLSLRGLKFQSSVQQASCPQTSHVYNLTKDLQVEPDDQEDEDSDCTT